VTALNVCTFSGASSLPLLVAEERRLFAAAGLEVTLVQTRSSDELMTGLVEGRFGIVHAAPDNFIAWRDRTGHPIVAWIGGASGPLALMARPGIGTVADLRDRSIAVDAPTSGFVSVLRKILREAGLSADDVRLEPLGATNLRADALMEGRVDATMLTLPWSAAAVRAGMVVLADGRAAAPRLQGGSGGSLAPWLEANPDVADAYLRALVAAITWLQLPGEREAARELVERRYGLAPEVAEEVRAAFSDPRGGWLPSALLDPAGMAAVCELRTENGMPPKEPPEAYLTLEPYRRVLGFGLLA
jgi:ABC-type nitrate/sulfonate/bicarbonate transport system substrate-binding protein